MPDYDQDSFDNTRQAVLTLAAGVSSADTMFGTKADVNPVHHLLGTAAGWGGLPAKEATYLVVNAGLPVGRYELHVGDDYRSTRSGPSRSTTPTASSNRTRLARTASTASPAYATLTARSPFDSVTTAPMRPTRSRSRRVGTTQSGSISHVPRSSTAPGRSPASQPANQRRRRASTADAPNARSAVVLCRVPNGLRRRWVALITGVRRPHAAVAGH